MLLVDNILHLPVLRKNITKQNDHLNASWPIDTAKQELNFAFDFVADK